MQDSMTEHHRQRDSIDKAVDDLKRFVHDLMVDSPRWTGHFTVHARDGVILDIEETTRYKLNRQ